MTEILNDSGIPWWIFLITCVCALLVGKGIRHWYKNKKLLDLAREKEERREEKKQMKRERKLQKKAQNRKK